MKVLDPSDTELVERIRAGDRDAFELLFRTHYPGLLRYARAELREPAEAEDVVHDVFLRLWRDHERIGGDRSLRTYLIKAVHNRVIDLVRHRRVEERWIRSGGDGRIGAAGSHLVDHVADPASYSDPAGLAEFDLALRQALANLPDRCRTAFMLCKQQGLSYAEAANVMGVSPATVKTQIARALVSLRTALDPFLALLLTCSTLLR